MFSSYYLSDILSDLPFIENLSVVSKDGLITYATEANLFDEGKLIKLLNSNTAFPLWIDYSEITANKRDNMVQLDLLGHSDEPVLLLESADTAPVVLFKFKKFQTNEDLFYGRDQKYLIEKCLINRLSNIVNSSAEPNGNFEKYFQICKNQTVKISQLNDELTKLKFEAEKFYTNLFIYFLKDEIKPETNISLSDSTLEYLQSSDLPFSEIETIAKEAYKIVLELSQSPTDIRIKRYFLPQQTQNKLDKITLPEAKPEIIESISNFIPQKKEQLKLKPKPGRSKLEKTIQLLDRYELAVNKLMADKLPVMGKNIANVCSPKISAPALTDSINKHKDRIVECLKLYPDNWPLLKTHYLPVQKMMY